MPGKIVDFIVLIILLLFSAAFMSLTNHTSFGNVAIFSAIFALPSIIYLSFRSPKNWKKIFISTLVLGLLFMFPLDLIAQYTHTWDTLSYLFPYRVAGVKLTMDNLIWSTLMTMYTITFYLHFFSQKTSSKISSRILPTTIISLIAIVIIPSIIIIDPKFFLNINHPYLVLGTLAIVPTFMFAFRNPVYIPKLLKVGIFFSSFFFIQEIIGMNSHFWNYPGNNYVGWINILGMRFPFEELFFWMMWYSPTLTAYYELFVD